MPMVTLRRGQWTCAVYTLSIADALIFSPSERAIRDGLHCANVGSLWLDARVVELYWDPFYRHGTPSTIELLSQSVRLSAHIPPGSRCASRAPEADAAVTAPNLKLVDRFKFDPACARFADRSLRISSASTATSALAASARPCSDKNTVTDILAQRKEQSQVGEQIQRPPRDSGER